MESISTSGLKQMMRAVLMEGCRERQRQRDRSQGSTSCKTQSKLKESFSAEHRLGETLGLLGSCVHGNRTLCMFLYNKKCCTKDGLCSIITYQFVHS